MPEVNPLGMCGFRRMWLTCQARTCGRHGNSRDRQPTAMDMHLVPMLSHCSFLDWEGPFRMWLTNFSSVKCHTHRSWMPEEEAELPSRRRRTHLRTNRSTLPQTHCWVGGNQCIQTLWPASTPVLPGRGVRPASGHTQPPAPARAARWNTSDGRINSVTLQDPRSCNGISGRLSNPDFSVQIPGTAGWPPVLMG